MRECRPFCDREDELIQHLYNNQNIKNWGLIASTLTDQYNFPRNAKQCRDRYRQFLDPSMQQQWNAQQEMYLNKLHNSIGNKWALIAQYFPGKTDNCLKNHFYSKLRKGLRFLNKIIKLKLKREFREIKVTSVYKIIEGFQEKFKQKPYVSEQVSDHCARLKNILLIYGERNQNELDFLEDFTEERAVINEIIEFNKNYKKKSKKEKRESLEVSQLFKPSTQAQYNLIQPQLIKQDLQQNESDSDEMSNESEKNSDKNGNINAVLTNNVEKLMEREQPELRKSERVFILVEDEELRVSHQSKLPVEFINQDQNLISSYRMSDEQNRYAKDFLRWSGSNDMNKFPFNFIRGSSSFQSYRSQSNPSEIDKVDMFDENIRISEELKKQMIMQQENQDLFMSQKS